MYFLAVRMKPFGAFIQTWKSDITTQMREGTFLSIPISTFRCEGHHVKFNLKISNHTYESSL